jgi:hypothetical protein
MKRISFLAIAAASLGLSGCGGGGGPAAATLVYQTDWTQRASGLNVTGESQRVSLLDQNGLVVQSQVMNREVAGIQALSLSDLTRGEYRLRVELFSAPSLGGVRTGEIETTVSLNGTLTYQTGVGDAIASIRVTPSSASLGVGQSRRFYASAHNAANRPTFAAPDSIAWSTLGAVGNVDPESGLFFAEAAGSGAVRATHTPSGLLGAATVNVQAHQAVKRKWTVMVFLNAANDLQQFSILNMNQMERVAGNPDVRFVVQWKQAFTPASPNPTFVGTRRYLVKPDTTNQIASEMVQNLGTNVDMGRPQTLLSFVNWAKTYYPADRYVLVVWNHGNGWRRSQTAQDQITRAVSYDDETGNAIQIWELGQALGNHHFDILAWDASLMQMLEVAYEVKDHASYVAGSEESPPGEGYPYERIFRVFRDNPDLPTLQLSKAFVDGMLQEPAYSNRKITQSVIDTSKLDALAAATSGLGTALINNGPAMAGIVQTVRNQAQSYSPSAIRFYRDLWDVANRLENATGIPEVVGAAANVKVAVSNAVVWEGHNAQSPGSRGISIDFSPASVFNQGQSSMDYSLLRLARDTQWNQWLSVAP